MFYLVCDLGPHHPFENHSMRLAFTQVSSEELTPGQGICSGMTAVGHPVTPDKAFLTLAKPSVKSIINGSVRSSELRIGALTSQHASRLSFK